MKILPLVLIFFTSVCFAANISRPPVDRDLALQTEQYFKNISDNFNNLEMTTTAPNGNRRGNNGDVILYDNSGTLELWANYGGGTTWQKLSP